MHVQGARNQGFVPATETNRKVFHYRGNLQKNFDDGYGPLLCERR